MFAQNKRHKKLSSIGWKGIGVEPCISLRSANNSAELLPLRAGHEPGECGQPVLLQQRGGSKYRMFGVSAS